MQEIDDGGPAFPAITPIVKTPAGHKAGCDIQGMTIRQWYAGQALIGLLANTKISAEILKGKGTAKENHEFYSDTAFQFADAMIERGKK